MRVLLDTTYARRAPYSGTAVYLERLQEALARLGGVEVLSRANRRRRPPAGGGLGSVRNLLTDGWWSGVELPRLRRRLGADLIHHPLPAMTPRVGADVITVHDLAFERFPDQFQRGFRTYAHFVHRTAARRAAAVICVSETTARDVCELWDVAAERIFIARHGPGRELPSVPEREPGHFLYVGDAEPRKNLPVLLEAYHLYRNAAAVPLMLVLAGSADADGAGVRLERTPGPERLAELYAGAVALVHPSLYEGFGLTLLEAMRAGVPVIASRSVEEVCGEAACYADPLNPATFAGAMADVASQAALREELRERGRLRAAGFSWDACARAHLDAYSLALSG